MDADVAALLVACSVTSGEAALAGSCAAVGGRISRLDLLVGVVDEIFLVRHDELCVGIRVLVSCRVGGCACRKEGCQTKWSREGAEARYYTKSYEKKRSASVSRVHSYANSTRLLRRWRFVVGGGQERSLVADVEVKSSGRLAGR